MRSQIFALGLATTLALNTAWAVPGFNYMGTIYDSAGNPSTLPSATVRFDIYAPNGTCLLYSETRTGVNLGASNGFINAVIGQGTRTGGVDPGLSLPTIFSNSSSAMTGASACSYTPAADDGRKLQIVINTEPLVPMMDINTTPRAMVADVADKLSPTAISGDATINASKVLSLSPSGVVSGAYGSASQIPVFTIDSKGRVITASSVAISGGGGGGSVTNVSASAPLSVVNGATTPSISISQASAGSNGYLSSADWTAFNNKLGPVSLFAGDISGAYNTLTIQPGAVTSAKMSATGVSAGVYGSASQVPVVTVDTAGRVTNLSTVTISGGGGGISALTGDISASGAGSVSSTVNFVGGVSAATISAGITSALSASDANVPNSVVKRNASGNFSAGALNLTGMVNTTASGYGYYQNSGGVILALDVSGGFPMIGSESNHRLGLQANQTEYMSILPSGNVGIGTTTPAALLDVNGLIFSRGKSGAGNGGGIKFSEIPANGTNYVGLKAADNIASDLIFTLPTNAGSNGQVLTTDGAGNMSWTAVSGGGGGNVTNVIGMAPVTVISGTSTPTISISQASGAVNGYLSSADWTNFNNKMGTSTVFAGDISGTYNSTFINPGSVTSAKISDASVTAQKMQASTTGRLFGRFTAGAGPGEEISVGSGLLLSGGALTVSVPFNQVTHATGTNTINMGNFTQSWLWNSATTSPGLSITANTLTTGAALQINSSSSGASGGSLLNLNYTGPGNLSPLMVQSSSTNGDPMIMLKNNSSNGSSNLSFMNQSSMFVGELAWGNTGYSMVPMATNALALYTAANNSLVFGTNNIERMRISGSGAVTISMAPAGTSAHGADIVFRAQDGGSGVTNGGKVVLIPGNAVGGGATGIINFNGHIAANYGPSTSLGTCGSGAPSMIGNSNDTRGVIILGSTPGTTCTVNFNKPYANAPVCVANWFGVSAPAYQMAIQPNTTGFTVTFSSTPPAGANISYICME